jgi:hypothetical protein
VLLLLLLPLLLLLSTALTAGCLKAAAGLMMVVWRDVRLEPMA